MKNTWRFLSLLPLAALIAGCGQSSSSDESDSSGSSSWTDTAKSQYDKVKADAVADWNDLKSFSADKKDEFMQSVKAGQADLDKQIASLKQEGDKLSGMAKTQYSAAVTQLDSAAKTLDQKIKAAGDASEAGWDNARNEVISAWDALKKSLDAVKKTTGQ
jgi:hypothetical protein